MLVTAIEARPLRSLERVRVALGPGIVSVVGPNGVGKTNLVEALYFALTGRSFRTSDRRELIPFGESLARAEATIRDEDGIEQRLLASVSRTEGRRHLLDGQAVDPATIARARPPVAVFAPDRLSLVKGPPAERRAHLDGFLAARWPARSELRKLFGQALAQRNAMVARVAAGHGSPDALDVWDAGVADAAAPLIAARAEAVAELAPAFATALAELGLEDGELSYAPRAEGGAEEIQVGLRERRDADLKLGRSSWGPHLDEVKLSAGGRALRRYGSQGQQRAALLALLFAEREALLAARRVTPLLLLDDVMSELDPGRRELLVVRLAAGGQTLITAADEESLPGVAREALVQMPSAGVVLGDAGESGAQAA
ncbi:MAG TPA: DNA replication and repair protein RecF [Solirubrobacterales bacterium]|nr:DNA replication and repair protein RecF [Solirubrobacterales bacterium]